MVKNVIKKLAVLLAAGILVLTSVPVSVHASEEELTGKTANEITQMMGKGWNMGNTFDATGGNKKDIYSQETSWGNPIVTKELIDGVAAAGYKTIRIPTTWNRFCDRENGYAINPDFMARIKEVVTWAYDDGLFVIINVHHESWVNKPGFAEEYEKTGKQLVAVWEQIADEFAEFDQHLIFEGMNEPRAANTSFEWNGNAKCYDAVNYLNQLFVETIRSNGKGHNDERMLMIPGYAASSSSNIMSSIVIPEIDGAQAENIAISVHCYSPYSFCLSDDQVTFDPGKTSDTTEITQLFKNIDRIFTSKGIPVVIGECGCTNSKGNLEARQAWFGFFGSMAAEANIPAIVWDNGAGGNSGGECHKYINRKTGDLVTPELTEAFLSGNAGGDKDPLGDICINFEPYEKFGATVLAVPSEMGFTNSKLMNEAGANHTSDAKLGLSMKVDSAINEMTARLDVSKFAGQKIYVSAWLYSKAGANVLVGISGAKEEEMAAIEAGEEWAEVAFETELPESAETFIYFKGLDNKFNVDDILVSINPPSSGEVDETAAIDSVDKDVQENEVADSNISVKDETNGKSNQALIIVLITAFVLIVIAAFAIRFKKK